MRNFTRDWFQATQCFFALLSIAVHTGKTFLPDAQHQLWLSYYRRRYTEFYAIVTSSRSMVKVSFDQSGRGEQFCQWAPIYRLYGQPFRRYEWSKIVLTFIWPLQGHQGQRPCRILNLWDQVPLVFLSKYRPTSHSLNAITSETLRNRQTTDLRIKVAGARDESGLKTSGGLNLHR